MADTKQANQIRNGFREIYSPMEVCGDRSPNARDFRNYSRQLRKVHVPRRSQLASYELEYEIAADGSLHLHVSWNHFLSRSGRCPGLVL